MENINCYDEVSSKKLHQDLVVDSIFVQPSITKGNVMKKFLLVALMAAMVAGTAEAGRRCGKRNNDCCETKCEVECAPVKKCCIRAPRIVGCTYSDDNSEGQKPDVCYLIPAPLEIEKHVHRTCHTSYSCVPNDCGVKPTAEQLQQLQAEGSIRSTTTCSE